MANYGVIYGLYCDQYKEGVTYYVGKTELNVEGRYNAHLYEARTLPAKERNHRHNWIRLCERNGWVVDWHILQELVYGDNINDLERSWIRHFGRENLCNETDGGEGQSGYEWTEERRAEHSAIMSKVHADKAEDSGRITSERFCRGSGISRQELRDWVFDEPSTGLGFRGYPMPWEHEPDFVHYNGYITPEQII